MKHLHLNSFGKALVALSLVLVVAVLCWLWLKQTPEDLVRQNHLTFLAAIYDYAADNEGLMPESLNKQTLGKYLKQWPTNPYTDQPVRVIRIGDQPCYGEASYMRAMVKESQTNSKYEDRLSNCILYSYGGPGSKSLFDWSSDRHSIAILANLPIIFAHDFSGGGYKGGQFEPRHEIFMRNGYPELAQQSRWADEKNRAATDLAQ